MKTKLPLILLTAIGIWLAGYSFLNLYSYGNLNFLGLSIMGALLGTVVLFLFTKITGSSFSTLMQIVIVGVFSIGLVLVGALATKGKVIIYANCKTGIVGTKTDGANFWELVSWNVSGGNNTEFRIQFKKRSPFKDPQGNPIMTIVGKSPGQTMDYEAVVVGPGGLGFSYEFTCGGFRDPYPMIQVPRQN